MMLMTTANLDGTLAAVANLLEPAGHFVFTIAHPCFWHLYWQYGDWFNYAAETFIEAPFVISLDSTGSCVTTHIHRPLALYADKLAKFGFRIEEIEEPMPSPEVERLYPEPWKFPRFLGVRCVRTAQP
jgi:hypothetical protein